MWFHNYSSYLDKRGRYLEDLYVQPAHRGQGVGKMALKHLARLAIEQDCGRFEWTVLDWNQNAIDFYNYLGADVLPEWRIVRVTGYRWWPTWYRSHFAPCALRPSVEIGRAHV